MRHRPVRALYNQPADAAMPRVAFQTASLLRRRCLMRGELHSWTRGGATPGSGKNLCVVPAAWDKKWIQSSADAAAVACTREMPLPEAQVPKTGTDALCLPRLRLEKDGLRARTKEGDRASFGHLVLPNQDGGSPLAFPLGAFPLDSAAVP